MNEYNYHHHDYGVGRSMNRVGRVVFWAMVIWIAVVFFFTHPLYALAIALVVCGTILIVRHQKRLERERRQRAVPRPPVA